MDSDQAHDQPISWHTWTVGEPSQQGKDRPAPRSGDLCPRCGEERLDYDGLLNLACPRCGYALAGCFT